MKSVGGMLWDLWCGMNSAAWMLMCIVLVSGAASVPRSCLVIYSKGVLWCGTLSIAWCLVMLLPFMHDVGQEIDQRLRARKVKNGI